MSNDVLPINKKNALPVKQQVTDVLDKLGFFVAFFLGLIGIVCLKLSHSSQFFVTLFPVSIMLIYAVLIYTFLQIRLGEDQSGDNLYYLGFLYTLISLAFALYQFDGKGGTTVIIENFGIAIGTTIAGLFLRILFNQMRHDPVDIEREARLELASAASRLRTNLLEVTHVMKSTLIAAQQQTAEVMQDYGKRFDDVAQTIIIKTDEAHTAVMENTKRLTSSTDLFIVSIEKLITRIDDIQPPTNLLENKLAPAIESIKMAGEEVLNRVKGDELTIKQLNKLIKTAINSSEQLENKVKLLADQSDKVSSIFSSFENINEQVSKSGKYFEEAAQNVTVFSENQKNTQVHINNLLAETTQITTSSLSAIQEKTSSILTELGNANLLVISEYSKNAQNSIETQKLAFKELRSSVEETLATTKQHNEKLAQELTRSREYTEKVHQSLVSLTESLAEKLSPENNYTPTSNLIEQ